MRKRHDTRFFPPSAPRVWDLGVRIGAALRRTERERVEREPSTPSGRMSPRPNVRAAHWNLYWTGKGRTVPRLKWIAPTLVAAETIESLPVTIRPVKP